MLKFNTMYSLTLLKGVNPSVNPWKKAKHIKVRWAIVFKQTQKDIFMKTAQSNRCYTLVVMSLSVSVTDASGRYSSQFFFGNDFWLGSHTLCQELQNTRTNAIVPPFRVNFHVAVLRLALPKELTPRVSPSGWVSINTDPASFSMFCTACFIMYEYNSFCRTFTTSTSHHLNFQHELSKHHAKVF